MSRDEAIGKSSPTPGGAPDPLIGKLVAERFRVLSLIARGGMGKIYKAEQLGLGRVVALKVLSPSDRDMDEEAAFQKRFEREASICSRLNHSNTVRIFDFGRTHDGVYYIAMEYLEGDTLHAAIKNDAPMQPLRVIHVIRQIAASLAEAHNQGIIHRDLKPGNVLLTTQGDDHDFVKVVDFGLVKHILDKDVTQAGLIVGSPMYMAPEQVRGDNVDHRTDIYAMGMIGYVMLTGKRPFERDTPIAVLMARMSAKPPTFKEIAPTVDVPASLEWVMMTALQIDKTQRFDSMHEVLRALKVCEAELHGHAPGATPMYLDAGRTVLPPDFADVSISRTRVQVQNTPEPESTLSSRAPLAGLSVAIVGLFGMVLLAVTTLLLAATWLVWTARPTLAPMAEQRAEVVAPGDSTAAPSKPEVQPTSPAVTPSPGTAEPTVDPVATPAAAVPEARPAAKRPVPRPQPPKTAETKPAETKPETKPAVTPPDPPKEPDEGPKLRSSDVRNPFKTP